MQKHKNYYPNQISSRRLLGTKMLLSNLPIKKPSLINLFYEWMKLDLWAFHKPIYLICRTLLWIFFFLFLFISHKQQKYFFLHLVTYAFLHWKKKFMCLTRLLLPTLTNDTTGYRKENEEIGLGFVYIPKFKIQKNKK